MAPTTAERVRHELAGIEAAERTAGERFLKSSEWRKWAGAGHRGDMADLAHAITLRPDDLVSTASFTGDVVRHDERRKASILPTPAGVLDLVEVIPADGLTVHLVLEGARTGGAQGTPDGETLNTTTLDFDESAQRLQRWGTGTSVHEGYLRDDGRARRLVDRVLVDQVRGDLADEIIAGDGSQTATRTQLQGVLMPGTAVPTYTRNAAGGEGYLEAVEAAATQVQTGGFVDRSMVAVASPDTMNDIRWEKDADGAPKVTQRDAGVPPPPVIAWVPSNAVPAGQIVVGDWWSAAAFYMYERGFHVARFEQHADYATRYLVLVMVLAEVFLWVRRPEALRIVTL